jgi:DNA-binding transcriptional LysR family regulator
MARTDTFSGVREFLAVARHGSFRAAAAELRVTPAAVSQAVKALEARVGMPLFLRTTRSVALSEAGAGLLARVRPAATEIGDALSETAAMRGRPTGQLRLSVPRIALDLVVLPVLPAFREAFPDITLELDVRDDSVDLGAAGMDAGIRIGQFIERDMVAVRLTPEFQWRVLGAPAYFARRGVPATPQDLAQHECIGYRFPTAKNLYRWQFRDGRRNLTVDVPGGVVVNDHLTMVALARAGLGLTFTADLVARRHLADGSLQSVLDAYSIRTDGLFLYFPEKSQRQPKLRAFIDFATAELRRAG